VPHTHLGEHLCNRETLRFLVSLIKGGKISDRVHVLDSDIGGLDRGGATIVGREVPPLNEAASSPLQLPRGGPGGGGLGDGLRKSPDDIADLLVPLAPHPHPRPEVGRRGAQGAGLHAGPASHRHHPVEKPLLVFAKVPFRDLHHLEEFQAGQRGGDVIVGGLHVHNLAGDLVCLAQVKIVRDVIVASPELCDKMHKSQVQTVVLWMGLDGSDF